MIRDKIRKPGRTLARLVRKAIGAEHYEWCEQNADDPRYDLAQGICDADDLPANVRLQCDAYNGPFYACEWPL
jgi:hypothetical protein